MRIRGCVTSLLVLFLLVVAAGCSKPEAPKPEVPPPAPAVSAAAEGKTLFEQKCGVCHGLDRTTARKESKEKWTAIIKDMQGKKAEWISDAEAAKIAEFLASEHGQK
jgi:mono/diheme cytochrome c family protein